MSDCGPCGTRTAITDASAHLVQGFKGTKYSPALNDLLDALDKVEIRMRSERPEATWKPANFKQVVTPYLQKPRGTEVIFKETPLYFENNQQYVRPILEPTTEGGMCGEVNLCDEPPAHQIPGNTYQSFTWSMQETAFETPTFCLRNLLHKENGPDVLSRYLARVERIPFEFYDNYIRNEIWDIGEKYLLAPTANSMMWNSPDRVSARHTPNINDYKVAVGNPAADVGVPTLAGLAYLEYYVKIYMGSSYSSLQVEGERSFMMVGVKPDIFNFVFNDSDCGPCSFVEGGFGFNTFNFSILERIPYAVKYDMHWFRGDFDPATGEFYRIPAMNYVDQNGGADLRPNPNWLGAKYGVLTFMTGNPFVYRRFGMVPNLPSNIPEKAKRHLSPRFEFAPLDTKCSWNRGNVAWRAEEEFGFQPTGEKVIHLIYRRDELASFIREAKGGTCVEEITTCEAIIPQTCSDCTYGKCCCIGGLPGYLDSTYSIEVNGDLFGKLGIDPDALPAASKVKTLKGVFDVEILGTNSARTKVTFGVNPDQHDGAHKCCEEQFIGFLAEGDALKYCEAELEIGVCASTYDPRTFTGPTSCALDAAVGDLVTIFFDEGCGFDGAYAATLTEITDKSISVNFEVGDFPDGVPCRSARRVCASANPACADCLVTEPVECEADDVTPIPTATNKTPVEAAPVPLQGEKGKGQPAKKAKATKKAAAKK